MKNRHTPTPTHIMSCHELMSPNPYHELTEDEPREWLVPCSIISNYEEVLRGII